MDSLARLPKNKQTQDLYLLLADLIDNVIYKESMELTESNVEDLVYKLFSTVGDYSAAVAYYNMLIKPLIGTKTCLDNLVSLLGLDATIVEWFNTSTLLPYKFYILFDETPEGLDIKSFIDLIMELKNDVSRLTTLKTDDCKTYITWDSGSKWDVNSWDGAPGNVYRQVKVCLGINKRYVYSDEDYGSESYANCDSWNNSLIKGTMTFDKHAWDQLKYSLYNYSVGTKTLIYASASASRGWTGLWVGGWDEYIIGCSCKHEYPES